MDKKLTEKRKGKSAQIGVYCGETFKRAFRRWCGRFGVDMANLARYFVMRELLETPGFLELFPEPERDIFSAEHGDLPHYTMRSQSGTQIGIPFDAVVKQAIDDFAAAEGQDKSSMFRGFIIQALADDDYFNLLWDDEEAILAGTHELVKEELIK